MEDSTYTVMGISPINGEDNDLTAKFYPCYLDTEKIKSTVAFGWIGIYESRSKFQGSDGLLKHLMTIEQLTDTFSPDKLRDMADFYINYASVIRSIHDFAAVYLSPSPIARPTIVPNAYDDTAMFDLWENKVLETYEKYLMVTSVFDVILYDQILNDLLWNSKFDPRDPRIREVNLQRINTLKNSTVEVMSESVVSDAFQRVKMALDPRKYKVDIDEDGTVLIKKNYQADLFRYYANSNRLMKMYKRQMKITEMKSELAKIFFINELIETKYIYNQHPSAQEKTDYKKYSDLRANLLSTFKTYLEFVLEEENEFNFNDYYERSPYAKVLEVKREQIKGVKNLLSLLLI